MTTSPVATISDDELSEITAFTDADYAADFEEVRGLKTGQLRRLIARLRDAEKDAARYRWLRDKAKDHASQAPAIVMLTGYCQPAFDKPGSAHLSLLYGEHAEIAIDTAMEKQP